MALLLSESEAENARLNELANVLKEEIRSNQRSEERMKHIENLEYVKNIIFKVKSPLCNIYNASAHSNDLVKVSLVRSCSALAFYSSRLVGVIVANLCYVALFEDFFTIRMILRVKLFDWEKIKN